MGPENEDDLLDRCREGEEAAWAELFERFYPATARFVHQLSHEFTAEDTEEICQETFLAVIRKLDSFNGKCQFQSWLFRVAGNKARDYLERQAALKRGGGLKPLSLDAEDPHTGLRPDIAAAQPTPDAALLHTENLALVKVALSTLDPPCREIIELRYFGDLGYDEISQLLNLNPKTVSSRLSKCLDKLEKVAAHLLKGDNAAVYPSKK